MFKLYWKIQPSSSVSQYNTLMYESESRRQIFFRRYAAIEAYKS